MPCFDDLLSFVRAHELTPAPLMEYPSDVSQHEARDSTARRHSSFGYSALRIISPFRTAAMFLRRSAKQLQSLLLPYPMDAFLVHLRDLLPEYHRHRRAAIFLMLIRKITDAIPERLFVSPWMREGQGKSFAVRIFVRDNALPLKGLFLFQRGSPAAGGNRRRRWRGRHQAPGRIRSSERVPSLYPVQW